ncbi:MAG: enoyl-CoA hydratase/isomerase family protein [Gammaproteobacteria bacterium]|nr:enoyl-CoA hydratase/isomerase family protein [Gammaproteobacteria bacterium]
MFNKNYADLGLILQIDSLGVATIYLNREKKHNALDDKMIDGLNQILDDLVKLENIKILVLRANGKLFCAGADLNQMQAMINYTYQENYADAERLSQVFYKLDQFSCPTIAVINGPAYGGGVGLICCTDLAISISTAEFCLSEVRLGLVPAVISPYLVKKMGYTQAKRYMLTAEKISSSRALELNILSEIVDTPEALDLKANQLVSILLNNSPQAMRQVKKLLQDINNSIYSLEYGIEAIARLRMSPEGQEGLLAFLEKRTPNWCKHD